MRYAPAQYAEAFSAVIAKSSPSKREEAIAGLLRSVQKNGDRSRKDQILAAIERRMVAERGGAWVRLEFARTMPERVVAELKKGFNPKDHVETAVRPELVAGVRITQNGETELDYSLARKLKKLFPRT